MTEETKLNCSVNHNYREGYQQGRADAIKEVCEFMIEYGIIDCHFCPCDTCDDDCWVTLEKTIEQLKEQNTEQHGQLTNDCRRFHL